MDIYNHFEYGELLACKLKAISHTQENQHFFPAIEEITSINYKLKAGRSLRLYSTGIGGGLAYTF